MAEIEEPGSRFDRPIQLPPHSWAMWAAGAAYAVEAAICSALLWTGYARLGFDGARWAVVSSIVVLQPGVTQSFQASVFRILANLIGAAVGFVMAWLLGTDPGHVILAMLTVVFCCLALRLEQSLRSACVSVIIVMTTADGHVVASGIQRAVGVSIGATLAVSVQLLLETLLKALRSPAAGLRCPPRPLRSSRTNKKAAVATGRGGPRACGSRVERGASSRGASFRIRRRNPRIPSRAGSEASKRLA